MTRRIQIIKADLKDPVQVREIIHVLDQYARDPMGIGRRLPDEIKRRLPEGLRKSKAIVFLGLAGKSPAAVAVCFMRYSTFSASPILNIHDFAVSPKHRRKGFGRAMLEHIDAFAKKRKCKRITLEVRTDNPAAQSLYKSNGINPGNPPYEYWVKELG